MKKNWKTIFKNFFCKKYCFWMFLVIVCLNTITTDAKNFKDFEREINTKFFNVCCFFNKSHLNIYKNDQNVFHDEINKNADLAFNLLEEYKKSFLTFKDKAKKILKCDFEVNDMNCDFDSCDMNICDIKIIAYSQRLLKLAIFDCLKQLKDLKINDEILNINVEKDYLTETQLNTFKKMFKPKNGLFLTALINKYRASITVLINLAIKENNSDINIDFLEKKMLEQFNLIDEKNWLNCNKEQIVKKNEENNVEEDIFLFDGDLENIDIKEKNNFIEAQQLLGKKILMQITNN